jgi:hypothetical protein
MAKKMKGRCDNCGKMTDKLEPVRLDIGEVEMLCEECRIEQSVIIEFVGSKSSARSRSR